MHLTWTLQRGTRLQSFAASGQVAVPCQWIAESDQWEAELSECAWISLKEVLINYHHEIKIEPSFDNPYVHQIHHQIQYWGDEWLAHHMGCSLLEKYSKRSTYNT